VKILERLRGITPKWRWRRSAAPAPETSERSEDHLALARESLQELLQDQRVPADVRETLAEDYREVERMLEKLEQGHLHLAVFGRVSVGKSALLNALLGERRFSTSPLHGETRSAQSGQWREYQAGNVYLIDTPGINEVDGEGREQLAREVAGRADLVLFVVDGDLTETETQALRSLAAEQRPILLILNKADHYTRDEREALLASLRRHSEGLVDARNLVSAAADPALQWVIRVDEAGNEVESERRPPPDVTAVKERLWQILEAEGKTLAALNASIFAGQLSDQVGQRLLAVRRSLGQRVIHTYCIGKGVAVAFNPVPVADLVAAAVVDVTMLVHLSKLYGLPLNRSEAGELVKTIGAQMLLLMGTVWAVHFVSSALKLGTGGLSAVVTGGAQGAVAYYSTYVVGQAAERYLAQGKSWGEGGPKYVVRAILDNLDRGSIMEQAKQEIRARLKRSPAAEPGVGGILKERGVERSRSRYKISTINQPNLLRGARTWA
jgi:small GTP-binding protein